jgi:DinB superfamily
MAKHFLIPVVLILSIHASVFAQSNTVKSIMTKKYDPANNLVVWPDEFNPVKAKWYVYNEIEINAKPEVVWDILIDAKKWHTFYDGAQSAIEFFDTTASVLKNGLTFKFHTMGLKLQPVMKEFIPNERMAWEVRRKNLTAYHAWVIVPTANGCRLITPEAQNGYLTFLQKVFQPNKLLKLHDKWLKLIKQRAEGNTSNKLNAKERNTLNGQLQISYDKLNTAIAKLNTAQLNFKPSEKKWSIAECIEHVTLAELRFPEIVKEEITKIPNPAFREKIRISDDEIKPKMLSKSWKAKSPEIFKPSGKFASIEETISTFRKQRQQTIAYINSTDDDLRNHFWKHPLTGHIDLYQTLLLMSAHLERHVEQIESIKSNMPNLN